MEQQPRGPRVSFESEVAVTVSTPLDPAALRIDAASVSSDIRAEIRDAVLRRLRRRGVVVGLSGGVDSSVVAALAVAALGPERVFGLLMPEADSSGDSLALGQLVADAYGIRASVEDIGGILHAAGCYRRRDDAIRRVVPEYGEGYRCKIVPPDIVDQSTYPVYSVVVRTPQGDERRVRLSAEACLGVVAATSFKQRVRKMMEYYHADRLKFAVAGTPNLLEYDQGFFVKNGDGAADLKPIAHLYKSQVYQLAEYLDVPEEIRRRPPTTDTYPLEQSQEEFYFGLPLDKADLCLYARRHDIAPEDAAAAVGLTPAQVTRVYRAIDAKREAARYLHMAPLFAGEIDSAGSNGDRDG